MGLLDELVEAKMRLADAHAELTDVRCQLVALQARLDGDRLKATGRRGWDAKRLDEMSATGVTLSPR